MRAAVVPVSGGPPPPQDSAETETGGTGNLVALVLRNATQELLLGLKVAALSVPAVLATLAAFNAARSAIEDAYGIDEARYPEHAVLNDGDDSLELNWRALPWLAVNFVMTAGFAALLYGWMLPRNVSTSAAQRRGVLCWAAFGGLVQMAAFCLPVPRVVAVGGVLLPGLCFAVWRAEQCLMSSAPADGDDDDHHRASVVRRLGRLLCAVYVLFGILGGNVIIPFVLAVDSAAGVRMAVLLVGQVAAMDVVHVLQRRAQAHFAVTGLGEVSAYAHAFFSVVRRFALLNFAGAELAAMVLLIPTVEMASRATLQRRTRFYLRRLLRDPAAAEAEASQEAVEAAATFAMLGESGEAASIVAAAYAGLALRLSETRQPPAAAAVLLSAAGQLAVDAAVELLPRALVVAAVPVPVEGGHSTGGLLAYASRHVQRRALLTDVARRKLDRRAVAMAMWTGLTFVTTWIMYPHPGDEAVLCGWSPGTWWSHAPCTRVLEWLE